MKKIGAAAHRNSSPALVNGLDTVLPQAQFNAMSISPVANGSMDGNSTRDGTDVVDVVNGSGNYNRIVAANGVQSTARRCGELHSFAARDGVNHVNQQTPKQGKQGSGLGVDSSAVNQLSCDSASISLPTRSEKEWNVRANPLLTASVNPIRRITDAVVLDHTNGKDFISLAQGDPAQFGPHMRVPEVAISALVHVVRTGRHNGYTLSSGLPECRSAVADYLSAGLEHKLNAQDVFMTSGCSQAMQHSIDALRFPGCNVLIPRPGFPLYETVCRYFGVEVRHYGLREESDWEVDLGQVAALIDENTAAMVVCNPGNPCGSVYTHHHLLQIATLAEASKVPIIADEVYASLVFGRNAFVPVATFCSKIPVIAVGGVSKNWLAPGWRVGWLGVFDPQAILKKARVVEAVTKIMQMTFGPSTLMQAAVPQLLQATPVKFFEQTLDFLRQGADVGCARANRIHGLDCPCRPAGSMFMMIRMNPSLFKGIKNDVEFSTALLKEESVLVLPGTAFGCPNWFRIVFGLSWQQQNEAWNRIEEFCTRHSV